MVTLVNTWVENGRIGRYMGPANTDAERSEETVGRRVLTNFCSGARREEESGGRLLTGSLVEVRIRGRRIGLQPKQWILGNSVGLTW